MLGTKANIILIQYSDTAQVLAIRVSRIQHTRVWTSRFRWLWWLRYNCGAVSSRYAWHWEHPNCLMLTNANVKTCAIPRNNQLNRIEYTMNCCRSTDRCDQFCVGRLKNEMHSAVGRNIVIVLPQCRLIIWKPSVLGFIWHVYKFNRV